MEWLSQNWLWLAFIAVLLLMMRRGGSGGAGGCCGMHAAHPKSGKAEHHAGKADGSQALRRTAAGA